MPNKGKFAQIILVAALVAGASYLFAANSDEVSTATLAWKGAGVWLLAVYAMLATRGTDGGLLTGVMAFGALGDVLVESNLTVGALAFIAGHVLAIVMYWRNRRQKLSGSQKGLAAAVIVFVPMIAWFLLRDGTIVVYALILALMAAAAWTSRFPRYRVGIGAMLFVASDLLIFANMEVLDQEPLVNLLIWVLYFTGQAMITIGVVQTLNHDQDSYA
ncbi:MAG: hypothetical protein RIS52_988 [Pseudomonadota bacterium]|jgi:uncharacterized membrane protein YhhN